VAEHLDDSGQRPNRRKDRPADARRLPRQRRGTTPQMHGRFPDHDVMSQADHWDPVTRRAVRERVDKVPPIRFFAPAEAATLGAFCDVVMAQDGEPRIPVLAMVDAKLHAGRLDGYRYEDMPDDRETWRRAARGLDEAAVDRGAPGGFAQAPPDMQHEICAGFAKGKLAGGIWAELPVTKAWTVVMRSVVAAFYSHPWAWNEIGFGGPAYPRGYSRLGVGMREAWEGAEAVDVDPVPDVVERGLE
jgi:Gluconate 2-dehydrogenase subunit 3